MPSRPSELKNIGYEIFMAVLAILSIVNLVLLYAFLQDQAMREILEVMNGLLSVIFLIDFTYRLLTAQSKRGYFLGQLGWLDLLSSLPFSQLKILRIFRLVRVYRLLSGYGVGNVGRSLIKDRAGSALLTLLMAGIIVIEFGSLAMLRIEEYAKGANITNASDALWYVIVTISTVGYGDQYPVTNAGRLLGALIIVVGVGIFGAFTGYLANLFLRPDAGTTKPASDGSPAANLAQLKALMAEQESKVAELEGLLGTGSA